MERIMCDYFPKRLRELREDRKISQAELADYVNVNRATISKYERGQIEPTLSSLSKISEFFGTTLDELVNPGFNDNELSINSINAAELYGLDKKYIRAIKMANSNSITPDKLIEIIEFTSSIRK